MDFDSHTDTLCTRSVYRNMSGTGVVCDVEGFALGLVSLNYVEIMSVETAYDNVDMGETYILVYAQIREFGTILKTYLAPPNQL